MRVRNIQRDDGAEGGGLNTPERMIAAQSWVVTREHEGHTAASLCMQRVIHVRPSRSVISTGFRQTVSK